MKVISVVGARPQFVKCAPVSQELRRVHEEVLVHIGQHYDYGLSEVFFCDLGIPAPDYHLDIGSGSHGAQTGRMLAAVEEVIGKEEPDLVLVYGDTNSTLAGGACVGEDARAGGARRGRAPEQRFPDARGGEPGAHGSLF
ncbi:MAG: UDP-N-acetylglucosamine 2-epimerase [Methanoculleus sp.]